MEAEILRRIGEPFIAGYFEEPSSPIRGWSRAYRRFLEVSLLPLYNGEPLYPCGPCYPDSPARAFNPNYSFTYSYNTTVLERKLSLSSGREREALLALRLWVEELSHRLDLIEAPHTVGGRGYTHSIPNYGRVIREGFDTYSFRLKARLENARKAHDDSRLDLYSGLLDVLEGIRVWHTRILRYLGELSFTDETKERNRLRIISAFRQIPFRPARNFFEALVCYNFIFYIDGCDNLGRFDLELSPYYERDLQEGVITHEEAVWLVRCLWENCDANNSWSTAIGGTTPAGEPAYSELTLVCLESSRNIRRPNLQLHIRRDMPQEVWESAVETIATGCGLPALYNEEEYYEALRHTNLGVVEEDLAYYSGGGCTETMIHGRSNVGSLDAGVNLALILEETLHRRLLFSTSFESFFSAYKDSVARDIGELTRQVSLSQEMKALLTPQPIRTLLVDDCIERGLEFNAGGARYNWSVINVAGIANVVDSLSALKEVVYEKREKSPAELLDVLRRNFDGEDGFRYRLGRCARFGNDDPRADSIARELTEFVFKEFLRYAPWRGGKFLPSCLMFVTYGEAGKALGATPDGRLAGEPLADSAGPYQGRDRRGPTAMLKSVTAIPHRLAPGTLVVNIRLSKSLFSTPENRHKLQDLIRTYFDLGGMQLQINVVDQETLKEAILHPERYESLVVRIGGYSEYFNRLSDELKLTVLKRTEHGL